MTRLDDLPAGYTLCSGCGLAVRNGHDCPTPDPNAAQARKARTAEVIAKMRDAPVSFVVPGPVVPWKRTLTRDGQRFNDPRYKQYRTTIRWAAREAISGRGDVPYGDRPVALTVAAMLTRVDRCDGDNILKAVGDALQGVVFTDDRQVMRALVVKLPADVEELLQVEVRLHDEEQPWP